MEKLCVFWRIGDVSIRPLHNTQASNPTGSQRSRRSPKSKRHSETIFIIHHRRHICSVSRPGARQHEHAPLFQLLLPIGSRGQHEVGGNWQNRDWWPNHEQDANAHGQN